MLHAMRSAILYDDGLSELSPLSDLRPAFDIRTGALTTLERWSRSVNVAALFVPKHLEGIAREKHSIPVNRIPETLNRVIVVNARCPLPPDGLLSLQVREAIVEKQTGDVAVTALDASEAGQLLSGSSPPFTSKKEVQERLLLSRPWHVRSLRDRALVHDLNLLCGEGSTPTLPHGVHRFGEHPLRIHPSATAYPTVVFDLEHGPVHISEGAVIRPGAIICGPAALGAHSTVLDRAIIRPYTAIGPRCKVAGEIGGTIFQGLSNKAHDGYLGDSFVGEWVNLGAGTTNSNLLNTYGEVISVSSPGRGYERTGEQFLGAIIGDHVKTAICTRIMTGSVLHTGGMFAQSAPVSGCTPRFTWSTDAGVRSYRPDKFLDVMMAAMARRKVTPSPAYVARINELHAANQ